MDALRGDISGIRRARRRWRFASALFDEGRWTLAVDGRAVPIEVKPMELLRQLLSRPGEALSKDELMDAVWPDVSVVEASLATAILKLRKALGDTDKENPIIETVPRIGYRLAVPVTLEPAPCDEIAVPDVTRPRRRWWWWWAAAAALAVAGIVTAILALRPPTTLPARPLADAGAMSAIRSLDVPKIEAMMLAGWDPNTPFDDQGNGALNVLLNVCEWNPGHDRQRLLLMARTLFDGGARVDVRNVWGDTAYSIAASPRYCGPDHPATKMLHAMCYNGPDPMGDNCLADYANAPGLKD